MLPAGILIGTLLSIAGLVLSLFALLGGVNQNKPWSYMRAADINMASSFQYYYLVDRLSLNPWGYCLYKSNQLIVCQTPSKTLTSQSQVFANIAINYITNTTPNIDNATLAYINSQATTTSKEVASEIENYMSIWVQLQPALRGILITLSAASAAAAVFGILSACTGPKIVLISLFISVLNVLLTVGTVAAASVGSKKLVSEFKNNGISVSVSYQISFWLVVVTMIVSFLAILLYWQGFFMYKRRVNNRDSFVNSHEFKKNSQQPIQYKYPSSEMTKTNNEVLYNPYMDPYGRY